MAIEKNSCQRHSSEKRNDKDDDSVHVIPDYKFFYMLDNYLLERGFDFNWLDLDKQEELTRNWRVFKLVEYKFRLKEAHFRAQIHQLAFDAYKFFDCFDAEENVEEPTKNDEQKKNELDGKKKVEKGKKEEGDIGDQRASYEDDKGDKKEEPEVGKKRPRNEKEKNVIEKVEDKERLSYRELMEIMKGLEEETVDSVEEVSQTTYGASQRKCKEESSLQIRSTKKERNLVSKQTVLSFDLFSPPPVEYRKLFEEWLKEGLEKTNKDCKYPTKNRLIPPFNFSVAEVQNKEFFYVLNEPNQWLDSDHINVIFYYLRKNQLDFPEKIDQKCTTVDAYFQGWFDKELLVWPNHETRLQSFIIGALPLLGKAWVNVDRIFIPINKPNIHWCLAVVNLPKWTIELYDSMRGEMHDKDMAELVVPLSVALPCLMSSVDFYLGRPELERFREDPMQIRHVNCPSQTGGDCGMFMVKFAEFMMCGEPLEKCTQADMPFFRNKIAIELFMYGVSNKRKD